MTCSNCRTEIEPRRIPFGDGGKVELTLCECKANRIALKYENTKFKTETSPRRKAVRRVPKTPVQGG